MNILVLCPHYAPDVAPTGDVMTAISNELAALGHRLHVVTALPWYLHHKVEPGWGGLLVRRERHASVGRITRVHPFPTDKRNIPARALAFAGYTGLVGYAALTDRERPDVVLAMSPPITLGPAGWLAARRFGVPFVFNVQDVFPDVAVELGVLRGRRLIAAASALERFVYRRADAVTVLSDDLADNVAAKLAPSTGAMRGDGSSPSAGGAATAGGKVRVIPNFVDTAWLVPGPAENAYREEHDLSGRIVVMYAGNVGFSQSLQLLVSTAREWVDTRPDVVFVINGGGSALAGLRADAEGLPNVRFVEMQPRHRLPELLAAGDIHVVPLRRGLARASVPSKLYSILAAGRPVLAAVDEGTEVARTVERAGAGCAVPPEDQPAFSAALAKLVDDADGRRAMGEAARRFVEGWASPEAIGRRYGELFEELTQSRR